jgi:hypothetical protein
MRPTTAALLAFMSGITGGVGLFPEPRKPRPKTQADVDAIDKAELKRIRKQAKRSNHENHR